MVYRAVIAIAGTTADAIAGSLLVRAAIGGEAHGPRLMQRECNGSVHDSGTMPW
jgi:hypothetical protein